MGSSPSGRLCSLLNSPKSVFSLVRSLRLEEKSKMDRYKFEKRQARKKRRNLSKSPLFSFFLGRIDFDQASWQGQEDSNPRPTVLETGTLPAELYPCAANHCVHYYITSRGKLQALFAIFLFFPETNRKIPPRENGRTASEQPVDGRRTVGKTVGRTASKQPLNSRANGRLSAEV